MDGLVEVLIIAIPTLVAVLSIIGIICIVHEEIRNWMVGFFSKREVDYNATPLAGYEPVRRWSDSTFTSCPLQSNEATTNMPIPPPVALDAVFLTSPNSPADADTEAPTSWQARQQERTRLNDASLRPKLSQQTRNSSRSAKPTFIRSLSRGSPGPASLAKAQAPMPHGRPRSRASSISETELRDLQAAFAFVEEQEREENKIRVCRSLEVISRNAGTKLPAGVGR